MKAFRSVASSAVTDDAMASEEDDAAEERN